jgi:hypothetical protein
MKTWLSALACAALLFCASDACTPSSLVPGGCEIMAPPGFRVHVRVAGDEAAFGLTAKSERVSVEFFGPGQNSTDAVVGWMHLGSPFIQSDVPLSNATVFPDAPDGLALVFTRRLADGKAPIFPEATTFRVSHGPDSAVVAANLVRGEPGAVLKPAQVADPPVVLPQARPQESAAARCGGAALAAAGVLAFVA